LPDLASEDKSRVIQSDVSMDDVAKCVAMVYKTSVKDIRNKIGVGTQISVISLSSSD